MVRFGSKIPSTAEAVLAASSTSKTLRSDIPFSSFVALLSNISKLQAHAIEQNIVQSDNRPLRLFQHWAHVIREKYIQSPQTTAAIFRLLFPEADAKRKYDIQELRLRHHLDIVFALRSNNEENPLARWQRHGCIGTAIRLMLERRIASGKGPKEPATPMTLLQVDMALNELAAHSVFSASPIHLQHPASHRRPRAEILRSLFTTVPPNEAAVVAQLILKDLSPLLFPLPETHLTAVQHSPTSVKLFTKYDAMRAWDPTGRFVAQHRVLATLDDAARAFETSAEVFRRPQIGIPVQTPAASVGQGCDHALRSFVGRRTSKIWAETKYDGERAQIHVEVRPDGSSRITIFSKSNRDSTLDRVALHGTIRDALGLSGGVSKPKVARNIILDAEIVAFSEELQRVDEFWNIKGLIESSAHGARSLREEGLSRRLNSDLDQSDARLFWAPGHSQESMRSQEDVHLALVFFDVLMVDDKPYLNTSYRQRRSVLEATVEQHPGRAMLAQRTSVAFHGLEGIDERASDLEGVFKAVVEDQQEGLVLKAEESKYNDRMLPWVKLKRNFIVGYGDSIDLVVLGAGWDKHRARNIRASSKTFTTFYIGALVRHEPDQSDLPPHFEIYFTVPYGIYGTRLEDLNQLIVSSNPIEFDASKMSCDPDTGDLMPWDMDYTFTIHQGLAPPAVLLRKPLLVELWGDGFAKNTKFYEPRFPRISKVFRDGERTWRDSFTLEKLHLIAQTSGRKLDTVTLP